jgi:hypothetical protein
MRTRTKTALALVGLATAWAPLQTIAQDGVPVGVVLEIKSPAYLKLAASSAPVQLDAKRDIMRKLFVDQSLQAGPGGRLKLGLSTGFQEIGPSETWFVVQQTAGLTPEQMKVAQALRKYGSPGGTRGMGSSLFSPAEGSAVRAKRMIIRWNPPVKKGQIEFRLEAESGQKLWSQKSVDAAAEKLDSNAAHKALADYLTNGGQENLVLIMIDPEANESRVAFSLLSKSSEQELEKELAKWEEIADPLLRSIGRAYEFGRRRLLVEAAEEYETALALAPESQDLIVSTIEAHRRTGNYARVAELRKMLPVAPH